VLPNPYGESGNTRRYDTYVSHLLAAANARKLLVADVYNAWLALPEATMLAYYLEPAVDHAHLNDAGCASWAEVTGNALLAKLSGAPPVPPAQEPDGGGGGGCGATGLEGLVAILLFRRRIR
jgi:hypothetical protein